MQHTRKAKLRPRKDVKRPRRDTALDWYNLLAEDIRPQIPEEWFREPWGDGKNAVALAQALLLAVNPSADSPVFEAVLSVLRGSEDLYWRAQDLQHEVVTGDFSRTSQTLMLMALRMAQLLVANSDGGGHAYNAIFLHGWHRLELAGVDVDGLVSHYRAVDAVQEGSGRKYDAFRQAWRAGMFRAAMALRGS